MTETSLPQTEVMPEHHPSPPIDFTSKSGITYRYDFENLTVEQCEHAEEVLEWKRTQIKNPPTNFNDITRSRGSEWLSIVASYLLVPVLNDVAQPFNLARIADTEQFVKTLTVKEITRLKGVLTDFFTATGKSGAISQLLQNRNGLDAQAILSELLMNNLKQPVKPANGGGKSSKKH